MLSFYGAAFDRLLLVWLDNSPWLLIYTYAASYLHTSSAACRGGRPVTFEEIYREVARC